MLILLFIVTLVSTKDLLDLSLKYNDYLLQPSMELSASQKDMLYAEYNELYNKSSSIFRKKIFLSSVNTIIKHNRNPENTWKMGLNKYSDMSFEEYEDKFLLKAEQNCSATKGNHVLSGKEAPDFVDWRLEGVVSGVKAQGHCGSCWTFSSTGCLEAHYRLYKKQPVLLSEQQLVDCAGDFDNHGCNGGLPSHAFEYLRYNGGIQSEETYPYKAVDQPCSFNPDLIVAKVPGGAVNITALDPIALRDAIAFKGPVSVAFQVTDDFRHYRSGIFSSTVCKDGAMDVNHAVLAVGYGTENDVPYYIIKNSHGLDFGENGYFRMVRGKNMCGILNCCAYPNLEEENEETIKVIDV